MHIMDLAIQGVRRFTESRKFPLKPGLNLIYGPTESGKSTLAACLLDLMYPDRLPEDDVSLITWGDPPVSRAGLTFGSGREVYRLLKDFKSGKILLTQYNPASQKFEAVSEDTAQIASMLATSFDFPPFDIFYHLFLAAADQMPSALPLTLAEVQEEKKPEAPAGVPLAEVFPGMGGGQGFGLPGMLSGPAVPGGTALPGMSPGFVPGPFGPAMIPGAAVPGMMPGAVMPGIIMGPAVPGMVPGAMPGGMSGMVMGAEDDGMSPEEREERLAKLREELEAAAKIEEINYEIDGLQQRLFDIESKKKSATQFDEFLEKAKEQLDRYPTLKRLPEKIEERLDRYKDLEAMKGAEIEKIDAQALGPEEKLREYAAAPPLHLQKIFQGGVACIAGGFLLFLVGKFVPALGFLRFFFLAAIPGVALIFYAIWQHLSRINESAELEKTVAELDEKKQQIIKRFEVETAVIEKLLKDTDSDSIEELKNKIQKFQELDERYRSILEKKKKLTKELNLEGLEKEEKELKKKIADLEETLRRYPPLSLDPNEMKREIKRLEEVIRRTNPSSPLVKGTAGEPQPGLGVPEFGATAPVEEAGATRITSAAPPPAADAHSTRVLSTSSGNLGDSKTRMVARRGLRVRTAPEAFDQMIKAAGRLFEIEKSQVLRHVQQRFNLYIQAFFNKRYVEARIEVDGSIALKQADTGRWVDFEQLTPAARDTAYLALQITLLELAIQKRIVPVILDNPLAPLDETATVVTSKALKRLAERTQIILFSSQRGPIPFADQNLSLT